MAAFQSLDPATLLLAIAVFSAVFAMLSLALARSIPEHGPALNAWAGAMACSALAFALYFPRGHAPTWLTLAASNLAAVSWALLGMLAHARFARVPMPTCTVIVLMAGGWLGPLATHVLGARMWIAVSSMSLAVGLSSLYTAWLIARAQRGVSTLGTGLSVAAFALLGVVLAARSVLVIFAAGTLPMNSSAPLQLLALFVGCLFVVGSTLGIVMMVVERQRQQIQESARRDGLTGLLNRSAFMQSAQAHLRTGRDASLLMIDLDHFKRVNDEHGHSVGDLVLAHAARLLAGCCRTTDPVGRYGGEEFCILLTDGNARAASDLGSRIVEAARRSSVRLASGRCRYTISVGIATRSIDLQGNPDAAGALAGMFESADRALYAAKRAGRDQWCAASAAGCRETAPLLQGLHTADRSEPVGAMVP